MATGIRGFVGLNGEGKTLAMVEAMVLPAWERDVPVVANFRLTPERLGFDPDLYRPLHTWRMIPELSNCVLLLDEINATLPSRESQKMPAELGRMLNQLRKPKVSTGWTGPDWARADKVLREVTGLVTVCRGYVPDHVAREPEVKWWPKAKRREDGRRDWLEPTWLPNRLFKFSTFDARDFDEFTLSTARRIKLKGRRWYWRTKHRAYLAYDSGEQVDLLDHLDEFGVCGVCSGTRTRPKCTCSAATAGAPAPEVAASRRLVRARV